MKGVVFALCSFVLVVFKNAEEVYRYEGCKG